MKARLPQGFGGGNNMMKQIQKVQEDMAAYQEELETREFTAASGGGAVHVVMTGNKMLKSVKLKPEVVDPEDLEMLEDLILAAVNEAIRVIEETSGNEMSKLTGGLSLPGMF